MRTRNKASFQAFKKWGWGQKRAGERRLMSSCTLPVVFNAQLYVVSLSIIASYTSFTSIESVTAWKGIDYRNYC